MRIAFVLPNYSGHIVGSLLVYYRFAMDLAAHGHQVDIWHPAVNRETVGFRQILRGRLWAFARGLRRHPVPWQEFPAGTRPRFRHGFRGLELDHDIVVAFSWRGIESLADIRTTGRLFGYVVEYETWAEAAPPMRERMEAAYKSGLPLLCSSIVVEEMLRSVGAPDVRSCVHGIDRSVYKLDVPVAERPSNRVGCPVRSEAVKSPEVLRAVLVRLREASGQKLSIWGFGGTNPPDGIRELLDEYHVHPSHEELAGLHNGSAIFFVPSRKEGFGMPAAEAMSCGCALASCDNGGVRTFAHDGIDALLVPPDDPAGLADAVLRLRDDHALRAGLASKAVESTAFLDWAVAGQRFRTEIGA